MAARAVPIGEYEPQIPVQEGLRRIIPQENGLSSGPGIEELGARLASVEQRARHQDAAVTASRVLADLRVKSEQGLLDAQQRARPDAQGFTPGVLKGFDQDSESTLKDVDPLARRLLNEHLPNLRASLAERAMQWEANTRTQYRTDSMLESSQHVASAIEIHPQSWQAAGAEQLKALNALDLPAPVRSKLALQMDHTFSEAAARGFAKQNPEGVLTRLKDPNDSLMSGLSVEQRTGIENYAKQQFVTGRANAIQGVYEAHGTTAGVKELEKIDHDPSIPQELRDPIRDQVMRQINVYRDQQREKFAPQIAQLESNIVNEKVSEGDRGQAWNLFQRGAYNTTQLTAALAAIDRSANKEDKKNKALEAAQAGYNSGTALDPEENKKGVKALFEGMTQGVPPGSPEFVNRAIDVTSKVGVVPDGAISWSRANLMGGDAHAAASAADLIARLEDTNPRAMSYALDPKTKAIAGMVNEAVKAGTDPEKAVEMARQNAALSKEDATALDNKWRVANASKTQADGLLQQLKSDERFKPHFWTSVPQIPLQMQGEFDALTKDYYRFTGGDVNQARQLAANDLKRVWGVSEVNGQRQIMAYAPEAMFPGLTKEVIREDIQTSLKDSKLDAKGVKLVPDPLRTARTQGAVWNLAAPDEHGMLDVVRDPAGKPMLYQLPVVKKDYQAVIDRQNEVAMVKAREEQAARKIAGERASAAEQSHVSPF